MTGLGLARQVGLATGEGVNPPVPAVSPHEALEPQEPNNMTMHLRNTAMDGHPQTSSTLLGRVAGENDEKACAAFVERYAPMVRSLARRAGLGHDQAEDVVQEVMYGAIDALRRQRYDRTLGRFKAWLKGVIQHKVGDVRRASRLTPPTDGKFAGIRLQCGSSLPQIPDPGPGPDERFEEAFEREWQKAAYDDALDQVRFEVEPITFQAFDLYVRKDRSPREVARLLGISRNTVYLAKSRILARIRGKLSEDNHDD